MFFSSCKMRQPLAMHRRWRRSWLFAAIRHLFGRGNFVSASNLGKWNKRDVAALHSLRLRMRRDGRLSYWSGSRNVPRNVVDCERGRDWLPGMCVGIFPLRPGRAMHHGTGTVQWKPRLFRRERWAKLSHYGGTKSPHRCRDWLLRLLRPLCHCTRVYTPTSICSGTRAQSTFLSSILWYFRRFKAFRDNNRGACKNLSAQISRLL